jgi:hypothetical protein
MTQIVQKMVMDRYSRRNPVATVKVARSYPTVCDLFGHRFNLRDYSQQGVVIFICTQCDQEQVKSRS